MGFDFDSARVAGEPVAVAAPRPVFGAGDEAAFDGVAVDVAELLDKLPLRENVEVVVASLPELWAVALESSRGFAFEDA